MPTRTLFNLRKHLAQEHNISPFTTYLKEIVYGGNDGIITTFAIVAGFAGAQSNPASQLPILTVLLFGFANLFSDAVSMALGDFISSRSEKDVYENAKQKERREILKNTMLEKQESHEILMNKGFTSQQAKDLVAIYSTNPSYWTHFMMDQELEMSNPEGENSGLMSLVTFFSFIIFGFIPLTPYVFLKDSATFIMSVIATIIALTLLGLIRWRVGHRSIVHSVGEILLLGGVAAMTAYAVGILFRV